MRSSIPAGSLHHEAVGDAHTLKSVNQELQPGKQKKSSVLSMVFPLEFDHRNTNYYGKCVSGVGLCLSILDNVV